MSKSTPRTVDPFKFDNNALAKVGNFELLFP